LDACHPRSPPDSSWLTRCALRFFYRETLGRDDVPASLAPVKQPRSLPVVLGPDELARFFAAIKNLKHRALLMTAYAAGLRVAEVTRLHIADIDSDRMVIRVRHGKGQKDRYVMLSPRLLEVLRAYRKAARPSDFLFPGAAPDRPLTTGSVRKVYSRARRAADLDKHVTVHTLRHNAASRIMPTAHW
jgi:integrase